MAFLISLAVSCVGGAVMTWILIDNSRLRRENRRLKQEISALEAFEYPMGNMHVNVARPMQLPRTNVMIGIGPDEVRLVRPPDRQ